MSCFTYLLAAIVLLHMFLYMALIGSNVFVVTKANL